MAKIKPHGEHETVNALSKLLGSTRRTIAARIGSSGLKPSGKRRGFATYEVAAVRDLLEAPTDPAKMTVYQRRSHFQAALLEQQLIETCSDLIPSGELEAEFHRLVRLFDSWVDSLPSRVAGAFGLNADIELVIRKHANETRLAIQRFVEEREESRSAAKGVVP